MAFAETANLAVKLTLGGNFTSQMRKASGALKGFDRDASRAYKAGAQIGTGIKRGGYLAAAGIAALATQVGFGLDQLVELESLTAQTNAVLKSTGGVAGQTAASVRALAEEFESMNAQVDDKAIQNAENVLLTFTRIGKGTFRPAIQSILDMSTALGTDLQGSTIQVGKALNDPIKGITALRRVGVAFTAAQVKKIKSLAAEGKLYKAQKIILKELQTEFGGSFLAGGQTTAGKVAKFGDAIEDLQKALATALLPTVGNVADALNELLRDPEVIRGTEELGRQIGELFSKDNIKNGIAALKEGFGVLRDVASTISGVVGTAVKAFTSLPPEIQKLLVGGFVVNKLTGGLVTNVLGGVIEGIGKAFGVGGIRAPLVNVQGGVVNVGGGIPGLPGGGAGEGILGQFIKPIAAGGLGLAAGLTIAAIAPVALSQLAIAMAGGPEGVTRRDITGRQATANARGLTAPVPTKRPVAGVDFQAWLAANGKKGTGGLSPDDRQSLNDAANKTTTAVETTKGTLQTSIDTSASTLRDAQLDTGHRVDAASLRNVAGTLTGAAIQSSATFAGSSAIVAAIGGIHLDVTTVNRTTTVNQRYGNTDRSRDGYPDDGVRER